MYSQSPSQSYSHIDDDGDDVDDGDERAGSSTFGGDDDSGSGGTFELSAHGLREWADLQVMQAVSAFGQSLDLFLLWNLENMEHAGVACSEVEMAERVEAAAAEEPPVMMGRERKRKRKRKIW